MARVRTETRDGKMVVIREPDDDEERGKFRLIEDWADESGAPIQRWTHPDGSVEFWRCAHNGQAKQRLRADGTAMPAGEVPEPPMVGVTLEGETVQRLANGVPVDAERGADGRVQWTDPSDGVARRVSPDADGVEWVELLTLNGRWVQDTLFGEIAERASAAWEARCGELERIEINAAASNLDPDDLYDGAYVRLGATDEHHAEFQRRQEMRRAGALPLSEIDREFVAAESDRAAGERVAWAMIQHREQLGQRLQEIEQNPAGGFHQRGDGRRVPLHSGEQLVAIRDLENALSELPNPPRPAGKAPHEVTVDDLTDQQLRSIYGHMAGAPEPAEAATA